MSRRRWTTTGMALLAAAATTVGLSACGSGSGGGDAYRVRAIFDNAFAVIPGEEVRIAGARVGTVDAVDVDRDRRAVLVLRIDDPGFRDFRADAECSIRPQSIIGERFVECLPTQPRAAGTTPPPALRTATFDGERQHVLPVERTSKPVDLDLVVDMMRLPERQRMAIILNELGVGLAARGPALRRTIRAALPGLRETDKVLALLGDQNQQLRALVRDSDTALAPVARDRAKLGSLLSRAADVQGAVAERRTALDQDLAKLPRTLRELRPTMATLSRLAQEGTPAVRDLRLSAPAGLQVLQALQPFSRAAIGPVKDLGRTTDIGRVALKKADPVVEQLDTLANETKPVVRDAKALTESLDRSGGFKRVLDYIFFQTLAVNAYDDVGHYLRINVILNQCATYATEPTKGCSAALDGISASTRSASGPRRAGESTELALTRRVLAGEDPQKVLDSVKGQAAYAPLLKRIRAMRALQRAGERKAAAGGPATSKGEAPITVPDGVLPGDRGSRSSSAGSASRGSSTSNGLLDYLMGDG